MALSGRFGNCGKAGVRVIRVLHGKHRKETELRSDRPTNQGHFKGVQDALKDHYAIFVSGGGQQEQVLRSAEPGKGIAGSRTGMNRAPQLWKSCGASFAIQTMLIPI